VIASEWFENRKHAWAPATAEIKLKHLEGHILPKLGQRPIATITAPKFWPCFA